MNQRSISLAGAVVSASATRLRAFNMVTLKELGTGRQGGDMTVLEDLGAQSSGSPLRFSRVKATDRT